jgi:hypothetical protein
MTGDRLHEMEIESDKHRMYVDEVGNSGLRTSVDPLHRFLSLTGVIIGLRRVEEAVAPGLEALKKKFFGSHPDEPVVLHRKELVNKKRPFDALRDPDVERRFNADLLRFLEDSEYAVITVTIDKLEHLTRYQSWRYDPYHFCLAALVERYVMWLNRRRVRGDVMAESRGGKEDRRLKDSFARLCERGTDHMEAEQFLGPLTSRQLKVKSKANNIAGLQVADIIAHPIFKAMHCDRERTPRPDTFGMRIYRIIERGKLDRSSSGQLDGWGLKWLP